MKPSPLSPPIKDHLSVIWHARGAVHYILGELAETARQGPEWSREHNAG